MTSELLKYHLESRRKLLSQLFKIVGSQHDHKQYLKISLKFWQNLIDHIALVHFKLIPKLKKLKTSNNKHYQQIHLIMHSILELHDEYFAKNKNNSNKTNFNYRLYNQLSLAITKHIELEDKLINYADSSLLVSSAE